MKKAALAALFVLAFAAPACAHGIRGNHWRIATRKHPRATSPCPFDGPEHMFTIVNAGVTGVTLAQIGAIEQATRDESFALRMYYGTPCATFGAGGTPIYLSDGYEPLPGGGSTYQLGGHHVPSPTFPYASPAIYVETGLTPYTNWVRAFSHEVVEDLVNPSGTALFGSYMAEVCDPVENLTYEVDQLQVSDFATPAWFNGSHVGPWDAARRLTGPA